MCLAYFFLVFGFFNNSSGTCLMPPATVDKRRKTGDYLSPDRVPRQGGFAPCTPLLRPFDGDGVLCIFCFLPGVFTAGGCFLSWFGIADGVAGGCWQYEDVAGCVGTAHEGGLAHLFIGIVEQAARAFATGFGAPIVAEAFAQAIE